MRTPARDRPAPGRRGYSPTVHIYRWDLDRTYLDTDIHSVRGMVRAALEGPSDKRTIPGAAALLRGLIASDPSCRVSILSGSPTQLRDVLEQKLARDGVRVDQLILKDNLGNLRRGRFRAIRGQIGYKLPQLLKLRVGLGSLVHETLFGDDTEVDALVYRLYAEAVAGRVGEGELARVLEAGGAYPDAVEEALQALRRIGRGEAVQDIFIHVDLGRPLARYRLLGRQVVPVFSWFQAAVILWLRERLQPAHVVEVAKACMAEAGLDEVALGGLVQDLLRRQRMTREEVERLLGDAPGLEPVATAIRASSERLGRIPPLAPHRDPPDFLAFLRAAS